MDLEEGGCVTMEGGAGGFDQPPPSTPPPRFPPGLLAAVRVLTTPAATLRCPDGDSDGDVALFLSV